jgi:hypothetical protein
MITMLKTVNEYFFGEEEISKSDAIYFYGFYALCGLIVLTVILPIWVKALL